MDIFLIKMPDGNLHPAQDNDRELLKKIKSMEPVRVTLKRPRNYEFHKKWFALLNFAYDYWEPPHNLVGHKNFDRFRKDIIILAGYYDTVVRLDGSTRVEPKSISFGSMSEDDFEKLYDATIEVVCQHVLRQYDGDMLKSILDQVQAFE